MYEILFSLKFTLKFINTFPLFVRMAQILTTRTWLTDKKKLESSSWKVQLAEKERTFELNSKFHKTYK
jgi:hypothetical protein